MSNYTYLALLVNYSQGINNRNSTDPRYNIFNNNNSSLQDDYNNVSDPNMQLVIAERRILINININKLKLLLENKIKVQKYKDFKNEVWNNCTICLEDYNGNSLVMKLGCKHLFHVECLKILIYFFHCYSLSRKTHKTHHFCYYLIYLSSQYSHSIYSHYLYYLEYFPR